MIAFSIVVPVYNAADYLAESMDSVLAQDYTDYELILIDDGSTDGSGRICEQYAQRDGRIRVVHQENSGPVAARRRGFGLSRGTYIISLDADDRLEPHCLCALNRCIAQHPCDVILYGSTKMDVHGTAVAGEITPAGARMEDRSALICDLMRCQSLNLVWNKAVRRELVQKIRIPPELSDIRAGDDILFAVPWLREAEHIWILPENLYRYRVSHSGITGQFSLRKGMDFLRSRTYMKRELETLWTPELQQSFDRMIRYTSLVLACQCAESAVCFAEKQGFFRMLRESRLYQEAACARVCVPWYQKPAACLFARGWDRLFVCWQTCYAAVRRVKKR